MTGAPIRRPSTDIATLLRDREVRGLRWFIGAQIVGVTLLGLGIFLFVTNEAGRIVSVLVSLIADIGLVALWWAAGRSGNLLAIGLGAGLVALAVTGPIPFLEWNSIGIDQVAASYVAKTGFVMGPTIIALSALTLNPRHPLMMTGLIAVYQLGLLGFAMLDDRTVYAEAGAWTSHVMGPALHLGKAANQLAFLLATGAAISLVAWIARRTVRAGIRLEKANGQLQRYFAPEVANRIATAETDFLKPAGRIQQVAVLSSDLAGFTKLSEGRDPNETVRLLSEYQAAMSVAIFRHGGSIDKLIGDGILATFGALDPKTRPQTEVAADAVAAGLAMDAALAELNATRAERGEPPFAHRIGIDLGPALVGNVGAEDRLEFTVIGSVVNLASRIESACKTTGDSLLISERVRQAGPEGDAVSRGRPALAGITEPPELFAPRTPGPSIRPSPE